MDQLNSLGTAEPLGMGQLEANMRDGCLSPMIVMLLRMLTSAAVQRRSDFFAPFILVRPGCMAISLCHAKHCPSSETLLPYFGTN